MSGAVETINLPGVLAGGLRIGVGRKMMYLAALVFAVGLAIEAGLWLLAPVAHPYALAMDDAEVRGKNRFVTYEHPRSVVYNDTASKNITPGIDGPIRFSLNAFGFRSPRLVSVEKPAGTIRVFCVGGSTTICTALDDADAWPEQLQRMLEREYPGKNIDVVNSGMNAESTRGHLNLVAHRVLPLKPDLVVMMVGINDTVYAKFPDYSPARLDSFSYRSHEYMRLYEKLRWRGLKEALCSSQVFRRVVNAKRKLGIGWDGSDWDLAGRTLTMKRSRHAQRRVEQLPEEMMQPKAEFVDNLRSIVGMCRAHGVDVVLVNQGVLWHRDMSEDLRSLCWMGFSGDVAYDTDDLARMIDNYNAATARLVSELGLSLVDVAGKLPKDTRAFYDDCHFNVNGARLVAEAVSEVIIGEGLLGFRLDSAISAAR